MRENHSPPPWSRRRDIFIGALQASVKVRRYAEAYLDHLLADAPEPAEFQGGARGKPSFSYLRRRIERA